MESWQESTERPDGRARVLLAEDNPVNQTLVVRILGKLGYGVDVAGNGREAVEATTRHAYGVVLMDCQMPEMDGYQATAEIRLREGASRHTAVVAMTASALPEDRERCLAAGMDDYVSKPISVDDIKRVLAQWLPEDDGAAPASAPPKPPPETAGPAHPGSIWQADPAGKVPPLFAKLVAIFMSSAPADVAGLRAAFERKDATAVRRAAHRLRGAALTLGLTGMAEVCEELETLRSCAPASARSLVHRLEEELDAASSALDAMVPAR